MQDKSFGQRLTTFFIRVSVLSALVSTPVLAGTAGGPQLLGGITFAPVGAGGPLGEAAAVPTLGTAALILLALLLGFIAWVSLRKNGPGTMASITLALAFAVGSSAGGLHWIQSIEAVIPESNLQITEASGQTLDIYNFTKNTYTNVTGSPMQPTAIAYNSCGSSTAEKKCTINTPVAPNEFCELLCQSGNASDIRLKENIVRVATAANGLPLYEYSYRGDSAVYRGVMAQDVLNHTPAAVHTMSNGYYAVDYGMLNLELERIR